MRASRKWRTSEQVPFAAQMRGEKFSCKSSFAAGVPQVRLVLNDAPLPLTSCARTHADARFGSCALAGFTKTYAASAAQKFGDAAWNATCGPATL